MRGREKEIRSMKKAGIVWFVFAIWFGQVFNLFPLGSRGAYELLFLDATERGWFEQSVHRYAHTFCISPRVHR